MVPDLWQHRVLHAGGEELAQPFTGLPVLIFYVLWVDVVDTQGLAYPQPFDGQFSFAHVKSQSMLESHPMALRN